MTEILVFGQLTDITQATRISWQQVADTDSLLQQLKQQYPALASAKFAVAVNNQVIQQNTPLMAGAQVALMPPFSGG